MLMVSPLRPECPLLLPALGAQDSERRLDSRGGTRQPDVQETVVMKTAGERQRRPTHLRHPPQRFSFVNLPGRGD